jgi:hypothetical protein
MRFLTSSLFLTPLLAAFLTTSAVRAEEVPVPEKRYFVGFGAGPQSGNGLHFGIIRGAHAVDFGLGLIYDSQDARWGYSTGLRYLNFWYTGPVNDTYAWAGGALTGNYRDQTASHVTSVGAGLGISFHFGLPIQVYFDSGLAGYFSEGLSKHEYYPAFNGGLRYVW